MDRFERRARAWLPAALLALVVAPACRPPDPEQELEIVSTETYWAVDRAVGQTQYIAPVVRLEVRNRGREEQHTVQATAAFHQAGEEELTWGSAWESVTPRDRPLAPGATALVVLKSDARYFSTGSPESMFGHASFRDASVDVFFKIGASQWVKFRHLQVERRIGSRSAQLGPD